jgi:hypothetical protein
MAPRSHQAMAKKVAMAVKPVRSCVSKLLPRAWPPAEAVR